MNVTRTPVTRVFLSTIPEVGEGFDLPEGEAHHVFNVLRARGGDVVEIAGGSGRLFLAEIAGRPRVTVLEEVDVVREDARVVLYQAVPKGGRMDLVVEKATEVGASGIVPLLTERGVVSPREGKVGRWRRVAESAARQSLGPRVPEVSEPLRFEEAVRGLDIAGIVLHNAPGLPSVEELSGSDAALFVGPEGGWSEGELALAEGAGLALAQLGPRRLRSETAGIVAVARARAAVEGRAGVFE